MAALDKFPFIELLNEVDSVPLDFDFGQLYKLLLPGDDRPHGYVYPSVVDKMPWSSEFVIDRQSRTIRVEGSATEAFQKTVDAAVEGDIFPILNRQHSELLPILGAKETTLVERFPAPLFGIVQRGAHMTAYTRSGRESSASEDKDIRIWVARRSRKLFAFPGKLDSTVAGGVKAGDSPFDCIVAEADEEASFGHEFARQHIKSAGIVSYVGHSAGQGHLTPTLIYVYDVELPAGVRPTVNDDEVDEFSLWTVGEVLAAMERREFKPNSASVMIDFFVRHGILTQENVPSSYVDITARLTRRLPVPVA